MIETILTIMLTGIATVGLVYTVMLILDMWKNEDKLLH